MDDLSTKVLEEYGLKVAGKTDKGYPILEGDYSKYKQLTERFLQNTNTSPSDFHKNIGVFKRPSGDLVVPRRDASSRTGIKMESKKSKDAYTSKRRTNEQVPDELRSRFKSDAEFKAYKDYVKKGNEVNQAKASKATRDSGTEFHKGHVVALGAGGSHDPKYQRLQNATKNLAATHKHDPSPEQLAAAGIARNWDEAVTYYQNPELRPTELTPQDQQRILNGEDPQVVYEQRGTQLRDNRDARPIRDHPNPYKKSTTDVADKLLTDRETQYQGSLQIGRNDAIFEEERLNQIKQALIDSGQAPEGTLEFIDQKIAQVRRTGRDIASEGSYMFEDDLTNYAIGSQGSNLVNDVMKTETASRQASQPIPGTEAHHPASVSSTKSIVENMDEYETRKLWDIARDNGFVVGSEPQGFIPLSKPAHTTGGKNWGSDYAHVGADGVTPDPGRFKQEPLPKGTTADQAWPVLRPVLEEQRQLNDAAWNHPTEQLMRQRAAEAYGGEIEWKIRPSNGSLKFQRETARAKGINATTISKSFDQFPGLKPTGLVPNVDVAVPIGARVPLGTKMPKGKNPLKGVPILGSLAGVGLSIALGESPAEAAVSNLPGISDVESSNNGMAERVGKDLFVDPRTNRIQPTNKEQVNKGLAYKNNKPVAVPYGSVAGKKDDIQVIKDGVGQLIDMNKDRLKSVSNEIKWGLKQLGIRL